MSELLSFLLKWWIPLFFPIYLLVSYYQAEDKPDWLKSSAKVFAFVFAFMAPMGVVAVAAFFFG